MSDASDWLADGDELVRAARRPIPTEQTHQSPTTRRQARGLLGESPDLLAHYIKTRRIDDAVLTYAAEMLAEAGPSDAVLEALQSLLSHPESYVREGALYGLARFVDNPTASEALKRVALEDADALLRDLASEYIDDLT